MATRAAIEKNLTLEGVSPDLFRAAQLEVRSMMESDSYPRFVRACKHSPTGHMDPLEREIGQRTSANLSDDMLHLQAILASPPRPAVTPPPASPV